MTTFADARRETRFQRAAWTRVRNTERYYARQLRKVAEQVRHIVQAFGADSPQAIEEMQATLHRFADILRPWARAVARRMLYETARRDEKAWRSHARLIGEEISKELASAEIGGVYEDLMAQQVDLITSIPREAAIRVHQLATEHLYEGRRFPEISREIMQSGQVSKARADLIARTETGRAAVTFQQARAEAVGSEGYIWRAVMDYKTRPELGIKNFARLNTLRLGSHRKLDGTFHRWDDPPIAGTRGERAHPGAIFNCFPGWIKVLHDRSTRRLYRAFYHGPLVALRFEGSSEVIDVTYNHPILAPAGFIAAGLLDQGDYVCCIPAERDGVSDADDNREISSFDDLFGFAIVDQAETVASTGSDFYGDVVDGQIDILTFDESLHTDFEAPLLQEFRYFALAEADSRIWNAIERSIHPGFVKSLTSFAGDRAFAGSGSDIGVSGADPDAQLIDVAPESFCGVSQQPARPQHFRRVVNKFVRQFSGHVYTLETSSGLYAVGDCGLQVGNCRCYAEPVLPSTY